MPEAEQSKSGLTDHEILMEIRLDVKKILKNYPDRREVYGVMGALATAAIAIIALFL